MDHLFAHPVTDINEMSKVLDVSFEAARRLINSLEEEDILKR